MKEEVQPGRVQTQSCQGRASMPEREEAKDTDREARCWKRPAFVR